MTHTRRSPLPARSVLLSVLLGSHPPQLPVRTLVRTAETFGIADGTARVALSRLVADGDVESRDGSYRLTARHLGRQHDQDVALRPETRPWRGSWDLAVLVAGGGGGPAPGDADPDLRRVLDRRRMAALRPGVWARPANLGVEGALPPTVVGWSARLVPDGRPAAELASRLWDLRGWAGEACGLLAEMDAAVDPAVRLSVGAAMVRHIRADPVLPPRLLPPGWPGDRLRRAYDAYRAELGGLISARRDG